MKHLYLFACTCCGAQLKTPAFHGGKPYGPDCLARLLGQPRDRRRDRRVLVPAARLQVEQVSACRYAATYAIDGIPAKFRAEAMCAAEQVDDRLPPGALMVVAPSGVHCYSSLRFSAADGVLIYADRYGRETVKYLLPQA